MDGSIFQKVYRIEPDGVGGNLEINLTQGGSPQPDDANVIYFRWGELPTTTEFDFAADVRSQPDQRLIVPFSRDEVGYVLIQTNSLLRDPNRLFVTASRPALALTSMSANCIGNNGGKLIASVCGG